MKLKLANGALWNMQAMLTMREDNILHSAFTNVDGFNRSDVDCRYADSRLTLPAYDYAAIRRIDSWHRKHISVTYKNETKDTW